MFTANLGIGVNLRGGVIKSWEPVWIFLKIWGVGRVHVALETKQEIAKVVSSLNIDDLCLSWEGVTTLFQMSDVNTCVQGWSYKEVRAFTPFVKTLANTAPHNTGLLLDCPSELFMFCIKAVCPQLMQIDLSHDSCCLDCWSATIFGQGF